MKGSRQQEVWSDSRSGKFLQAAVWKVVGELKGGGRTLGACTHSSWRWAELGGEERWRHLHGTTRSEVLGFGFIQLPVQVRLSVLHQWKLWANLE